VVLGYVDSTTMLQAIILLAVASSCSAFSPSASALQTLRPARHARSERLVLAMSDAAATASYSLDNMVLDGPLKPLKDQVRAPHAARAGGPSAQS
jgi:hypothetical protein